MIFADSLADLAKDYILVEGPAGDRTAGQLLDSAERHRSRLSGLRVAINSGDPVTGIEALIAVDGQAESVTLLPPTLTPSCSSELMRRAGCDLLIGSLGGADADPRVPVFSCLDAIGGTVPPRGSGKTTWNLATSGTTDVPRLVAHTLSTLSRTVRRQHGPSQGVKWGLLYDYTRFAGLQVVLQAMMGGCGLITTPRDMPLRESVAMLASRGCTHLSATPTLWRAIVMTTGSDRLPLRQVTLGGEIADDRILATLKAIYPDARVTHIYASTEAGVGFSVKDGLSGFPAAYIDDPPSGIAIRIFDGRLQVKSAGIGFTYVGTDCRYGGDDGWIDTGDNVEVVGDRVFFLGRASGVINVGGNKVHPEEVERLLMKHPDVLEARVWAKPSSLVGALVVADVVPVTWPADPVVLKNALKTFLRERVDAHKVPSILNIVASLEKSAAGKIARGKQS